MCEKKYKRYVTMGLRNGQLHHIIARRGETPDDIIRKTLDLVAPNPFLINADRREKWFDRLYIMEVGDEGTYGNSTNLKLLEITEPISVPKWSLVPVKGIFAP